MGSEKLRLIFSSLENFKTTRFALESAGRPLEILCNIRGSWSTMEVWGVLLGENLQSGSFDLFGPRKPQNDPLCNFGQVVEHPEGFGRSTIAKRAILEFSGPENLKVTRFFNFGSSMGGPRRSGRV